MKVRILTPFMMSSISYAVGQEVEFSQEQTGRLLGMGSVETMKRNESPSVNQDAPKPESSEVAPAPVQAVTKKSKKKKS